MTDSNSFRPKFHFSTPKGWCNDPNGFSQFGGNIHLFFQHHPYSTQWGPMHWGHAVSKDLLHWQMLPIALSPTSPADSQGCFSGTAITKAGRHLLVYTGVQSKGQVNLQNQCIAVGDGLNYQKYSGNPVLTAASLPFEFQPSDFRDPKIWEKDGHYFMLCVIKQLNNCGAMVLFQSEDCFSWTYKGIIDSSKDGLSRMWECPDFFNLEGKDFLIFSPQEVKASDALGFHDGNNSVYVTGTLDYEKCIFKREVRLENNYTAALIDYGIDFYAPQTTKLADGRTILIAWMQAWESYITPENYTWSGMMTLPRELSFKNNRLYQTPVREFEKLKTSSKQIIIEQGKTVTILKNQNRQFEVDFSLSSQTKGKIRLTLGSETEQVFLEIDCSQRTICFDRTSSQTPGAIPARTVKITTGEKDLEFRVIVDTCSMEVFINQGLMTFTNAFFFKEEKSSLWIKTEQNSVTASVVERSEL